MTCSENHSGYVAFSAGSTRAKDVCTEPGGEAKVVPPPGFRAEKASPLKRMAPAAHSALLSSSSIAALVSRYSSAGVSHRRDTFPGTTDAGSGESISSG